jgi:hypothetical protein
MCYINFTLIQQHTGFVGLGLNCGIVREFYVIVVLKGKSVATGVGSRNTENGRVRKIVPPK